MLSLERNLRDLKIMVVGTFPADSTFAHAINTLKTADGFQKLGHATSVLCKPPLKGPIQVRDIRTRYGLSPEVEILFKPYMPSAPLVPERLRRFLQKQMSRKAEENLISIAGALQPDVIYCRAFYESIALAEAGFSVVVESHAPPSSRSSGVTELCNAFSRVPLLKRLITIHPALADGFARRGVNREKIRVVPDAVDLELFTPKSSHPKSPGSRFRITYAGSLERYKGIDTILEAARLLPGVQFSLYGGQPRDQARVRGQVQNYLSNVSVHGWIPHTGVARELWNSSGLLLVPSAHHASASWTSPVKLAEYLASGTPTIATTIPALQHWLSDEVIWTPPDDADALAQRILELRSGLIDTESISKKAQSFARKLTYESRASKILEKL